MAKSIEGGSRSDVWQLQKGRLQVSGQSVFSPRNSAQNRLPYKLVKAPAQEVLRAGEPISQGHGQSGS